MKIKDFLNHNFNIIDYDGFSDLQWILEKLGLPISGRKDDLIDRIVDNERFHPNKLYNWLVRKDLKGICEYMGLKVTGRKPELWSRILEETNNFNNAYPDLKKTQKNKLAERKNFIPIAKNKLFLLLFFIWIGFALILAILHLMFPEFQFILLVLVYLEVIAGIIGFIAWGLTEIQKKQIPLSNENEKSE